MIAKLMRTTKNEFRLILEAQTIEDESFLQSGGKKLVRLEELYPCGAGHGMQVMYDLPEDDEP